MEQDERDLLQQIFAENNELRAKNHALSREIFSKALQLEKVEDELRQTQSSKEEKTAKPGTTRKAVGNLMAATPGSASTAAKDLEDAMFSIERKNNEIRQLKEELGAVKEDLESQEQTNDQLERELADLQNEFDRYKTSRETTRTEKPEVTTRVDSAPAKQVALYKELLEESEQTIERQKRQIQEITSETVRKYSEQQTQMQGLESLLEQVKQKYEEFIQVTKIENDSYRQMQQAEYERLKEAFETHKKEQYDEKRAMMLEHQAMLFTLQTLFDEYKKTCEFLYSTELSKLEDELINVSSRYEHEILYIIQAKDKFYSTMMVSKDAKIMNLIEGSDLTSLLQKHEMDIENVRKEYTLELERIRTQQESEQKHVISLLQRQNSSLESKAEKLSMHIKTLEMKIKDLLLAIEGKNKVISEKNEQRAQLEARHALELEQERLKYAQILQEKEFLRHKVIRLNMESKGTGENTVENMLKRISRETTEVSKNYTELSTQYDTLVDENTKVTRQLKDREKWIEYLEREVKKRSDEFKLMVTTFEEFLASRSRQKRKERTKRLMKLTQDRQEETVMPPTMDLTLHSSGLETVRIHVPDASNRLKNVEYEALTAEKHEMTRAMTYLKRFKTVSRTFATGDMKKLNRDDGDESMLMLSGMAPLEEEPHQPIVSPRLPTAGLRDAKLYQEREPKAVSEKVYQSNQGSGSSLKVYDYETQKKSTIAEVSGGGTAMVGSFKGTKKGKAGPPPIKSDSKRNAPSFQIGQSQSVQGAPAPP